MPPNLVSSAAGSTGQLGAGPAHAGAGISLRAVNQSARSRPRQPLRTGSFTIDLIKRCKETGPTYPPFQTASYKDADAGLGRQGEDMERS